MVPHISLYSLQNLKFAQMVQDMDRSASVLNNPYMSCIKINGKPILPPLMTPERRQEMRHYRELAKGVEARLHMWARQCAIKRSSVDSGVIFSSSDQTPDNVTNEREPGSLWRQEMLDGEARAFQIIGGCNEATVTSYFEANHPVAQLNDCHIIPATSILNCKYSDFRPWEKIEAHSKDTCVSEVRSRRTWQIPHDGATISELRNSLRHKWDEDKARNYINRRETLLQTEHVGSAILTRPFLQDRPVSGIDAPREIPTWEASLVGNSNPVKTCEGVMDFSKNLHSESVNARLDAWEQAKTSVVSPFLCSETGRTSTTSSSSTLRSEPLGNNSDIRNNAKPPVASAFTSPEMASRAHDDSTSSVALTSSTDLNQYMNVTGSSGSGSPGRDTSHWLAEDPLRRSSALTSVTKSYPIRQELLLASCFSDPNICPLNDSRYLENFKNYPSRIKDSNLNTGYDGTGNTTSPQATPSENQKLVPPEINIFNIENCDNRTQCTEDSREIFNNSDVKCLSIPNVKLQNNKTTTNSENMKGSAIPVYKPLHSPSHNTLKFQRDQDDEKRDVSPPKLVRQNSYTLESPSPLLIAHVETQKRKSSSHDMTGDSNTSSKTENKSSDLIETKKCYQNSKKDSSSSSSSASNKKFISSPYRNRCTSRIRDHKNLSLPSSNTSSPVKLRSPFISLDCLPSAVSKEPGKSVTRTTTRNKRKDFSKSGTSPLNNVKTFQRKMPEKITKKNLSTENVFVDGDKNLPAKQDNKNIPLKKDSETIANKENSTTVASKIDVPLKEDCERAIGKEVEKPALSNALQENLHNLVVRLQSEHNQQMAELLLKQKKEQDDMHRAFVEQQGRLMLEIYKICPEILSLQESQEQTVFCSVDSERTISPSNRNASTSSDTKAASLNLTSEKQQSIVEDSPCDVARPSSVFETSNEVQNVNSSEEPEVVGNNACSRIRGGSSEDQSLTTPPRITAEMERQRISCSRQLFPALERRCRVPVSQAELEKMAAIRITAAVKGYLTRRLFRTARVQEIILMIRDTLLCAVQINQECWPDITSEDVDLHRRLIHQVTAACHALHDVFFKFSAEEKMAVIAADRERIQSQTRKPPVPRPLSAATRRALERKMLQGVQRRPQSAGPRPCRIRSAGLNRNSFVGSGDVGQSAPQGLRNTRRSGSRKPWR